MLIEEPYAVYKAIWRYLDAYTLGGGSFPFGRSWDWPTLYAVFPQIAATLKQCQRQIHAAKFTEEKNS